MLDALFAITSGDSTSHYYTQSFGSLREVLMLLHRAKENMAENPSSYLSAADWLLQTSKRLQAFSFHLSQRLFQPLGARDFVVHVQKFESRPRSERLVSVNYDTNLFAFSQWTPDGIETLRGPLDGVTAAYDGALRRKNSLQTYLNEKVFAAEMERICTTDTAVSSPPDMEPDENAGPKLSM